MEEMIPKRSSVTLKDIALHLHISTATVSLALRNKSCVAEKTRQRVQEAVKQLGYVYNRSAARLRTQKSGIIGLIVPNVLNPFFTELTSSVEETVDTLGFSLLLAKTSEDKERQARAIRTMLEYSVEGILLCPAVGTRWEDLQLCRSLAVPLVVFTRPVDTGTMDYIGPDNRGGAGSATRYLLGKGHRRIAFIGGMEESIPRRERNAGFRKALQEQNIRLDPNLDKTCETTLDGGYRSILELMEEADPPTAAVCYNDITAFGVILGLWACNIVPGKDFDVIGFDNISDAALWSPSLTTLSCPPKRIGNKASRMLLDRIQNPMKPAETIILPPELILRDSA